MVMDCMQKSNEPNFDVHVVKAKVGHPNQVS
jgi:hypothetical protein